MIVYIDEVDNDYGTVTDTIKTEFNSLEEAREWCRANSWSGYTYSVDVELTNAVNDRRG